MGVLHVQVAKELRFLLRPDRRHGVLQVVAADTDTAGHLVQSLGIPLTEVGRLTLDGEVLPTAGRPSDGLLIVGPIERPQQAPTAVPRFLLDVHLGGLARRLRLLGLDAAYEPDADDPDLVRRAVAERRVLLTQDRGLLRRRAVLAGALVRGSGTSAQLDDVLDRFAPPLAPWTRCTRCGGLLGTVAAAEVSARLEPGTRRTYQDFARCRTCAQVYWRGAHAARLERVVERAEQVVGSRLSAPG